MRIHREGNTTIFITLLVMISAAIIFNVIESYQTIYHYLFYLFLILVLLFILYFFRSPKRKIETDPDNVLSGADGTVVAVERTVENEYFKKEVIQVSVFMSPLNIHLNRYPVSGIIDFVKHSPGSYFVAWSPKSSDNNERNSLVITTKHQRTIMVRQVAGAVARRIVSYSRPGDIVQQGEELGFIKFGSRVDLFLPVDSQIMVKNGDRVKSGMSIIAKL